MRLTAGSVLAAGIAVALAFALAGGREAVGRPQGPEEFL